MSDAHDWQELIDRHLRGELNESEKERLAELLDSDATAAQDFVEQVQWDTRVGRGAARWSWFAPRTNAERRADAMFAERTAAVRANTDDNIHQSVVGHLGRHHRRADCKPVFPAAEYGTAGKNDCPAAECGTDDRENHWIERASAVDG